MVVTLNEKEQVVEMYFIHSMSYGKYLELAHGGRYKIVWPTTLETAQKLWRSLRGMFR